MSARHMSIGVCPNWTPLHRTLSSFAAAVVATAGLAVAVSAGLAPGSSHHVTALPQTPPLATEDDFAWG